MCEQSCPLDCSKVEHSDLYLSWPATTQNGAHRRSWPHWTDSMRQSRRPHRGLSSCAELSLSPSGWQWRRVPACTQTLLHRHPWNSKMIKGDYFVAFLWMSCNREDGISAKSKCSCSVCGKTGVSKSSKNGVFYKSSYLRFDFFISMQNWFFL